jgi:hypothetical protein
MELVNTSSFNITRVDNLPDIPTNSKLGVVNDLSYALCYKCTASRASGLVFCLMYYKKTKKLVYSTDYNINCSRSVLRTTIKFFLLTYSSYYWGRTPLY